MKKQISDHEISRSIHWLSIRLEARINTELENFISIWNKMDRSIPMNDWPKGLAGSSYRKLRKIALQLESVLYIVKFQNKEIAEIIESFLWE